MTMTSTNQKSQLRFKLSTRIWKTPSEAQTTFKNLQQAYIDGVIDRKPQDNSFVYRLFKKVA